MNLDLGDVTTRPRWGCVYLQSWTLLREPRTTLPLILASSWISAQHLLGRPVGNGLLSRASGIVQEEQESKELLAGRRTRQHKQRQCQAGGELWQTALCRPQQVTLCQSQAHIHTTCTRVIYLLYQQGSGLPVFYQEAHRGDGPREQDVSARTQAEDTMHLEHTH